MTNRIDLCFEQLRAAKRKAFIPYICAGDPTLDRTVEISLALDKIGADILELGVPFSDPLADGIVNQLAAQRALGAGATVPGVLDTVRRIRAESKIPIVLYTYMNPILQFGWMEFHRAAESAGVEGLLILDLPSEEDITDTGTGIAHIRLIAPTTSPERKASIAKSARGFIYYVSQTGVTGRRDQVAESLKEEVEAIRAHSDLPVAVGFGISNPEQAAKVAQVADAVVVGSAIVDQIAQHGSSANLAGTIASFVRPFVEAVKRI
jgi:tryptophan synthase alpha chain